MKKKVLLAIVLVVVLLGAGLGYAYFATDALKSDKQLFFSYLLSDDFTKDLKDTNLEKYVEKQTNTTFKNKGKITFEAPEQGSALDGLNILNSTTIDVEGKTNTAKKLAEQKFTVELSQGINIPIQYKRDGETYGIQTKLLSDKFIAIKNEDLKTLADRFGMDTSNIPDNITLSGLNFSDKEISKIKDKYSKVLYDNMTKDMFSKTKTKDQTKVTMDVSAEQFINLIEKLANALKKDKDLLNKLSAGTTVEDLKTQIDNFVDAIKETDTTDADRVQIVLTIKSGELTECEIKTVTDNVAEIVAAIEKSDTKLVFYAYEDNELVGQVSIEKFANKDELSYIVGIKANSDGEEVANIQIEMAYKNLAKLDDVEETITADIVYSDSSSTSSSTADEKTSISVTYNNVVTFDSSLNIDAFNSNNAIIINDATDKELQDLFLNVYRNFSGIQ